MATAEVFAAGTGCGLVAIADTDRAFDGVAEGGMLLVSKTSDDTVSSVAVDALGVTAELRA